MKIRDGRQHIRSIVGGRTEAARRSIRVQSVATKADGQDQKTGVGERLCLLLPTLFMEGSTVREDDAACAASVKIGPNLYRLTLKWECDQPLSKGMAPSKTRDANGEKISQLHFTAPAR